MRKWCERRWWHYVVTILTALLPISGYITALVLLTRYQAREGLVAGVAVFGFFAAMIGFFLPVLYLIGASQSAYWSKGVKRLLAVVDKKTKAVVAGGLEKTRLRSFPFHSDCEVMSYPASFAFSCPLQPMTRNPKVVSLTATVEMELPPHSGCEPWFPTYLRNQEAVDKNFKRRTFDVLQHHLPQELAERLNPYDESSQTEFHQFVMNALYHNLDGNLLSYTYLFPDPVLKARFEAQRPENR
ncbi:MAG: hypothetical protein WAP51_01465 [Candidatus Sungiibacteriota bacterium]